MNLVYMSPNLSSSINASTYVIGCIPSVNGERSGSNGTARLATQDGGQYEMSVLSGAAAGAMLTIILSTIVGNALVIASVRRFERLRVVANSFIVSLAVADLLVALLVMTFSASQHVRHTHR